MEGVDLLAVRADGLAGLAAANVSLTFGPIDGARLAAPRSARRPPTAR